MVLDSHLNILDTGAATNARTVAVAFSGSPVAAYALPQKLNAEREIVVLTSAQTAPTLLTVVPQASVGPSWTADEDDADACTDSSITLGTTGPDGEISLREAVCEANNYFAQSNTGTVTITVPANTYNLSLNTGGVAGELQAGTVSGATISIIGLGGMPAETVINQTDGIDRDLNEDPAGAGNVQLSVSNLTMSGGFPATNGGGAILSTAGDGDTLTITNMVISGNTSTASGGGVGFLSGSGTVPLSITNTTFVNNQSATTAGGSGGGLSVSVASGISASVSLSTFTGNSATGASGAGGGIAAAGTITVSDSRIVGNVANSGTGYYQSAGTATIIDNWWGCNSGPGSSGCDAVAQNAAATAAFNPWIVLTIDANPSTIQIDGNSTLTADLTNDSNGGTGFDVPNSTPVTFSDTLGTVTPLTSTFINGTAQAIFTAGNAPGAGSGTATVDNQAVSATITITKGTPTVTVMASPTTITLGQSSTITATVSGSGLPPTGTVNVTDGLGNGLGDNCVITLSSGSGSCTLTPSAAGALTVTATYNGDVNYGNATGTTTLTVSKAAPTVNVTPSPGTITLGQTSKMTVTVAGPNGVDAPTGTVNVTDGLGNGSGDNCIITLSSGAGNCTLTPSAASTLTVTATYSGDNNYAKADGASALTVGKATPTVMVTPMPGRITFGQSSSIAVTVTGPNGVNQPTGTVNVTDGLGSGAGDNCVITLSSGGGSCTLTPSAVGNPNVRSTYNGDSNYNPASSNAPVTVIAAPTATKVVSSLDPSVLNESITFTATVSNASSTGVPPTGKVQFVIDGNDFGNAVSLSGTGNSVVASVTTSGLPDTPSPHQVVANYENTDGNFSGSNGSLPSGQTVQDFSLTLSASSNEIWPGFTGPGGPPKGTSTLTLKAISVNGFAATLQNLACPNVRTLGGVPAPTCVFTDPKTGQPKSTLNLASGSDSAIVTISLAGQTNPPHGPNGLTPTGNYNLTVEATDTSSSPQLTHPTQFGLSVMHNQGPTCVAPSLAIPTVSLSGIQTVKATVMCSDPENALQGDVVFDWGDGTQSKVPAIASGQHEYVANHVYGNAPVAVNPLEITVTATDNVAQAGLMELPYAQPSATVSLTPGQSPAPTATINLAAVAATTVKLSCPSITSSGGAPVSPSAISLSCSFSNSSLTLSAYPNSTQVTVAIQTSAGSAAALSPSGSRRLPASLYAAWSGMPAIVFLGLGMSSIGVTRRRIRSRRFASWLGLVLVMSILAGLVACSGLSQGPGASSGTGGTPAGSYSLLVQGTDANGIVQTSAIIPVEVEQ